jgi:hypothetical protein
LRKPFEINMSFEGARNKTNRPMFGTSLLWWWNPEDALKAFWTWVLLILCAGVGAAQQGPVPVEQEPHHHVVLKNDSVLVIHVNLPAGDSSLYHTHTRDRVSVVLTSTILAQQKLGEPEGKSGLTHPGSISAIPNDGPYTHWLLWVARRLK